MPKRKDPVYKKQMLARIYLSILQLIYQTTNNKHSLNPSLLFLASIYVFSMSERNSTLPVSQNSDAMQGVCDWCTFKLSNRPETINGENDTHTVH